VTNELNSDSMELMETIQASFDCSDLENPMGESRKDDFCKTIDVVRRKLCFVTV
jgi:hypothetical protein